MPDQYLKYHQYSVADFMLDEDFLLWIKQPDATRDAFWNELVLIHPHQTGNISDARKLAAALNLQKEAIPEDEKTRIWQSVLAKAGSPAGKMAAMKRSVWYMAAAAIILIIGGFVAYRFLQTDLESIKTAWGEKRSVILPDGSQVVLNANSQVTFDPHPPKNAPREVWINGEAFFEVVHKNKTGTPVQEAERFIVHLPNMNVEVLGTTFTVNTRRDQEQVVLQSGSVKVLVSPKQETVYLKPGEAISYNKDKKQLSKTTTNASDATLWKENQLKFNNTSLREIIQLIEDNYGYKVEVTDDSLLNRTIGGTLSSENEQILFKALENMLEVKITVTGKTLTISRQ